MALSFAQGSEQGRRPTSTGTSVLFVNSAKEINSDSEPTRSGITWCSVSCDRVYFREEIEDLEVVAALYHHSSLRG